MKITRQELVELLSNSNATRIKLQTTTPVKMNKRNNPLANADVKKSMFAEFLFNAEYGTLVADAIKKSLHINSKSVKVAYESEPLPWGHWLSDAVVNKVIEHNSNLYLRYYNLIECFSNSISVNGIVADAEQMQIISEFMPKKKAMPKTQAEAGVTAENRVACQVVSFDNISRIILDEVEYELY